MTVLQAGLFPEGDRIFYHHQVFPINASLEARYVPFAEGKLTTECEPAHSPASVAEVKPAWSYTYTLSYVFVCVRLLMVGALNYA